MVAMNTKTVNIEILEEIGSTNDYIKEKRALKQDRVVVALRQTSGRGTKGRSFVSSEGGIYLSKLTFYEQKPSKEAFTIMASAAVAVCATLRYYGLQPVIKWANDVFVGRKKICGILIENVFSGNQVDSSIVGIGLNVNNVLPTELKHIATTMGEELGKKLALEEVTERLILELSKERTMEEYRAYLGFLGEKVILILGDERVPATLLSVDDEGRLAVEINEEERLVSSGEVSLRIEEEKYVRYNG